MDKLELVGLPGLAHLLNLSRVRSGAGEKIMNEVVEMLSEFLQIDRYEVFRRLNDVRVKLASGESIEPIERPLREDLKELSSLLGFDPVRRIPHVVLASSLLGSFYTGAHGVPFRAFRIAKIDETMALIATSAILSRINRTPQIRLDLNDGLALVNQEKEVIKELFPMSLSEYSGEIIANTLYISRVVSSPSDTFLHGVLGTISFSPGLKTAAEVAKYLRDLSEKDVLEFVLIIGFYLGLTGLKKKIRKLQYEGELYRTLPITHDILLDALKRYKEEGKKVLGELYLTPVRLIKRSLNRQLTHSEAKALALTMIIDLRRSVLSRVLSEDTLKIIVSDALSSLYKSLSHIYKADQAHNISNRLVAEDGLSRIPSDEENPLYAFLRSQFDSFELKYMDDIIFELPFRLRLLKKSFNPSGQAEIDASTAMSFISSLGTPMRGGTAQKLLGFLADALQSGRLSSVEIFYKDGKSVIKYKRSTRIESTERILRTNFPTIEDMFFFSRVVRGILDRNSFTGRTERTAYEAERLSKRFMKTFISMRKKHIGRKKRFDMLSDVHPIVLLSLPLALVASYSGETLADIMEHIYFRGDHPSKAVIMVSRGDAEEIFNRVKEALKLKPLPVDLEHAHILKVFSANGLTINYRDEIGKEGLRPLRFKEALELIDSVRPSLTIEEALYTVYNIGKKFGYVKVYEKADTVITLNYFRGSVGFINSTLFMDIAPSVSHVEVFPFDRTLFEEASRDRTAIRSERSIQEFFGSFYRFLNDGYAPMVATDGKRLYIRLLSVVRV